MGFAIAVALDVNVDTVRIDLILDREGGGRLYSGWGKARAEAAPNNRRSVGCISNNDYVLK